MANKYIQQYNTQADYEAAIKEFPNVSLVKGSSKLYYEDDAVDVVIPVDYSKEYLTFVALEDGQFSFTKDVYYSIDSAETWVFLASNTNTPTITAGNKIMWKQDTSSSYASFTSTAAFDVEGNAMSLVYGDDFVGHTDFGGISYALNRLFYQNTNIISAENLSLPATTLTQGCYAYMFNGCTSLVTAPELPATTLSWNCYEYMFSGCTSLTTAPQLPATTLAGACYDGMFRDCTSLTTAPELPATTLTNSCYDDMFHGCTSLTTAPELPATTLTQLCYHQMFRDCTSLTTAPELPATTLAWGCYSDMFSYCSNINSITCYATDISASECTNSWVLGVAANGTFTKAASMTSWTTGANGIPTNWTVVDAQ